MEKIIFPPHADDPREILKEECGLSAAINMDRAAYWALTGLVLQQKRGEKGWGLVSLHGGNFSHLKKKGAVTERLKEIDISKLPGRIAIGHNRYATAGDFDLRKNIQPLIWSDTKFGPIAIAHNGTIVNHHQLKQDLLQKGVAFQSTTDTEIFLHLITRSKKGTIEEAILETLEIIPCAYSLLIMTRDKLFAIRDRFGVRPLSVADMGEGHLVFSENYPFEESIPESRFIRDIRPGEMLVFTEGIRGFKSIKYTTSSDAFCIFEAIYFSHPRTTYQGYYHEDFQQQLGIQVAHDNPDLDGDVIMPLLKSGKQAAIGLQKATGIPYKEYMERTNNPLMAGIRSFTGATLEERTRTALMKQHLRKDKILGKVVIVVDDSIVRAITARIVCERLRRAGAKRIIFVVSAPPITRVCYFGMAFLTLNELVAYHRTRKEIKGIIASDELIYNTLGGLHTVVEKTYKCGICSGCFGGKYAIQPENTII